MKAVVKPVSEVPATIYDVAERANVSPATVSRVLRGTQPVAPATEERVRKAVAALRFRPSRLGVALAERKHAANGIVFPDLSGPFYTEVVLGYEEMAAQRGRSVLILSTRDRADAAQAVLSLADRVDGMVLFGRTVSDDVVQEVAATGVPVVLLGRPEVPGTDVINTENERSACQLTRHLLDHGHRRVVYLGDPTASADAAGRWAGVSKALKEARRRRFIATCGADESAGRATAKELLRSRTRPDALVCFNDEVALGAMLAAEELGLRPGADVAITGWDDVMAARFARPALTTVRQPMRELGAQAAAALDERITGARAGLIHRVLPTEVLIRDSCGGHRT
ncbi:LacI family DNA-binding transcriptional regulator [Kibdelosporangium persicum]|uniref:LacI family transcriptional regulator n=1 Tax=Kibdelosporangium persicum TaxID=2698649 RepID=A0ABX2EWJ8_9PSEU|nr:LacI family DNA-binding transcriptional regulator [Kibdelosporangium persicum]NRN63136.1 LacI family transcriptional regulator [Kibdelosporangium persicum]